MHITKRPISKHQRARLIAWTLAMLMWLSSVLCGAAAFSARHERQRGPLMSLAWLTRRVKMLIVSRGIDFAHKRRRLVRAVRGRLVVARGGALRALLGARLHRRLNRKGVAERIAVLIHALQHIDEFALQVATRLKRGLTRRWRYLFDLKRAPNARVRALAAAAPCSADTS
jgi:hypothetical protein